MGRFMRWPRQDRVSGEEYRAAPKGRQAVANLLWEESGSRSPAAHRHNGDARPANATLSNLTSGTRTWPQ